MTIRAETNTDVLVLLAADTSPVALVASRPEIIPEISLILEIIPEI